MTDLMEVKMVDFDDGGEPQGRLMLWTVIAGLALIMTLGAVAGFFAQMDADGKSAFGTVGIVAMGLFATTIAGLAYVVWRNMGKMNKNAAAMTRRDRLNNKILLVFGAAGGAIGLVLAFTGDMSTQNPNAFSSDPIPAIVAVILAVVIGLIMPLLSYYWHLKVVDEQEEAAYRAGALIAMYAFWFTAPTWWLLWRGGLLPAPDGIALYMMTIVTALIVWLWKKYG